MARTSAVDLINARAEEGAWWQVAGLAGELWPVLKGHLSELHEVARLAVEHYRDHLPSCDLAGRCEGCRPR